MDQYKGEELVEAGIATLTVSDWTDWQNGTYVFEITHTGVNTQGEEISEEQQPLPKYDEKGNLYNYVLREVEMTWDENVEKPASNPNSVFKSTIQPGTYLAIQYLCAGHGACPSRSTLSCRWGRRARCRTPR